MTTFVLSIWGTPTTVEEPKSAPESPAPESRAATGSFARSKGASLTRSAPGGATRAPKRICLPEQSPASNLDAATGIEGVTVRHLAWFLLECVQWVAVKGDTTVILLQKPSNAVESCVGEWFRDVDGTDLYFPPCSDVADYPGFYTEEEIHGSGWQIGYTVKHDLAQGKRELAETIAKAPAAYCNYSMLMQKDYEASLDKFGSVMANNMVKGWNFDTNDDFFKLYVGGDVTRARWAPDYAKSPCLGTFTATARERSSATAQCNADGEWSTRVEVTREYEVRKGAPGGVVILSKEEGKFPLVRGSVLTLTFSLCNSTSVAERTERTIAHEDTCCVCMDRPPVAWKAGEQVACPQGHNAMCAECLLALYKRGKPCPLCREPWTDEAVAPIRERADAKARAEKAAWRAAEQERESAERAHIQAQQAAAVAAEELRLSEKIDKSCLETLVGEGFAYKHARAALDICDNHLECSRLWLSEQPLGQLCSKYGVEHDGRFWTAVDKMEEAKQHRVLRELHVVNVPGAPDVKWLLCVSVKEHDGKDDEVGEVLEVSDVSETLREYKVKPALLIKVTIWNWSTGRIHFAPVYIPTDKPREPEDLTDLKGDGEGRKLPYQLQLAEGDNPDVWGLMDKSRKDVLKLRFSVC
jgi:hypothetical protein